MIVLRAMHAGDIAQVMQMAATLPEAPHWPLSAWGQILAGEGSPLRIALVAEVLVAEVSAAVVGVAIASVVLEVAELESIAVATQWQRHGVGGRLLKELIAHCAQAGAQRMTLEVRASNLAAQALYRAQQFVVMRRRQGYYRDPPEDAVVMERLLG